MKQFYVIVLAVFMTLPMFADYAKPRIAVFDPTSSGAFIDDGTKIAIREIISSTIVNAGSYDIVERSLLEKVMQEQRFSNSGIVDDGDATEIGKLAGANKVVLSVVTSTGGRNMLSVKMIDVKTASVEKQKVKVVTAGELLSVVESMTQELVGRKSEKVNEDFDAAPTVNFQFDDSMLPPTPGMNELIFYLPACRAENKLKEDKMINVYIDKELFGGGTYNDGFTIRIDKNSLKKKKKDLHVFLTDNGFEIEFDEERYNYFEFQSFQRKGTWKSISLKEKKLIK